MNPNVIRILTLLKKNKGGMHEKQIAKELDIEDYHLVGMICSELEYNEILEGKMKNVTWEGRDVGARVYKMKDAKVTE